MLTTKPLKPSKDRPGAAGIVAYCQHRQRPQASLGGYYVNKPAPSCWAGSLAAELGYAGPVDAQRLHAALEGKIGDQNLSKNHDKRRFGHDLTFSAPKSVSLVALVAGDERLVEAHHQAMQEAIDFIEDEVAGARRGKQGQEGRDKSGIAAAVFDHEDSRTVNGKADPQLHSHAIVLNVSKNSDGKLQALDLDWGEEAVKMHIADAIYKNKLARIAQELGYSIERTEDGFELSGITREEIEGFSQRKEQIDEALETKGLTRETSSAEQRGAANTVTRESKSQLSQAEQRWEWRERAREAGLDLDTMRRNAEAAERAEIEDSTTEATQAGARHLSERDTVHSWDQVRLETLKAGVGRTSLSDADQAIRDGAAGLVQCGDEDPETGEKPILTTARALRREQHILHLARESQGAEKALTSPAAAERYIRLREQSQGFEYSAGQREALKLGLTSSDRYVSIVGAAGAGKTTAMSGVVEAARSQGFEIIGIAPSTSAARELREAGADDTRTVASFVLQKPKEEKNPNRLVIMDEAGMVSAKDMEAVMESIERDGGRLLMVGDPRQLESVESGNPYQRLMETGAIKTATIGEIKRQKDPALLRVATLFSEGKAGEAVKEAEPYISQVPVPTENYDENGKPKPTTDERRAAISAATAAEYLSLSREARESTLLLAGTNDVRQRINENIREALKESEEIAGAEVTLKAYDKADLTRERAARAECYQPGWIVRLREKKGKRWVQTDYSVERKTESGKLILRDKEGNEKEWQPTHEGRTFKPRELPVAAGDRLVFREPRGRGKDRIVNGSTGVVQSVDPDSGKVVLRMDADGQEVTLPADEGIAIDRGWALTVHMSQGKTVDNVICSGEANKISTAEAAYVSATRERHKLKIICDNTERLQKTWSGWADRTAAAQAADREREQHTREALDRLRQEAAEAIGDEGDLDRRGDDELDIEDGTTEAPSAPARTEQKPAPRRRPRL